MFEKTIENEQYPGEFVKVRESFGEVKIETDFGGDGFTYFSPKEARKIAKALKRAARDAEGRL